MALNDRKMAATRISLQILEDLLKFPIGHHITDINRDAHDRFNNTVSLLIEGPTLPVMQEGQTPEEVRIICERIETRFQG